MSNNDLKGLKALLETITKLRDPQTGCPWDLKQTHKSLAIYCIEEAFEAAEAMESGDTAHMIEELGDVLLQVSLHGQILKENSQGDFDLIAQKINDKMIERHPHVFLQRPKNLTADQVLENWNSAKLEQDQAKSESSTPIADKLKKIPLHLPGLHKAVRYGDILQGIGFDWSTPQQVWEKVNEEVEELKQATSKNDLTNMEEELGDLFFVLAQWARKAGIDPEQACRLALKKFTTRIAGMEILAPEKHHKPLSQLSLPEQEQLWEMVKKRCHSTLS